MDAQLIQKVENALNGFETFKTDLAAKAAKLDAFDEAKLNKIADAIGEMTEAKQAYEGRLKAIEDGQKALETAINRAPASNSADSREEAKAKGKKLFNEFARNDKHRELHFDDFVKSLPNAEAELKVLSTANGPDGGYLVTPEFGGIVNTFVYESSPIRQLASVTTIGTDMLEVVIDNGEPTSGWVGETESRTETNTPTLNKLAIPVNELYAEPRATQKMLDDGIVDVEAWLAGKVGEHFARKEATAFVNGTGFNQPRGLLTYTAGTTVASSQVEQVVSGSGSTFTYDGLIDLTSALKEPYQANAVFLCRRASLANLLKIKDGQSQPIFNLTYDKTGGVQTGILGKQLYFAADIPAVGSNALAMIYGDMRASYQIVDRMGLRVLRDAYTAKPYVKFYTTKRVGGAVVNFEAFKIQKIST
jgi:HK97 family phage major capsid protein